MKYLFSFIIPTYNGEKTIGQLLSKLKEASRNYNTEIIVIDSSSTDNTLEIVQNFKSQNSIPFKIIKIKKEEFNHGGTRNLGVRTAKGKFVCFLSQDAIPRRNNYLQHFLEDFNLNRKVVVIWGKQIPYADTPFVQKIEVLCRFKKLDTYTNSQGILIQTLEKPFLQFNEKTRLVWYSLFNTFACYKRNFLLQHPFPKTLYGEDLLMAKKIIKNGFWKIYDRRCQVTHSHKLSIVDYYRREKADLSARMTLMSLRDKINIITKLKTTFILEKNPIKLFFHVLELFIYYGIKVIILFELKISHRYPNFRYLAINFL